MPTFQGISTGVPNVARTMPAVRGFMNGVTPVFVYPYSISGVTKGSTGAVLAGCRIELFRTADDSNVSQAVSDANGIYSIPASNVLQHYLIAYLAGSPDVAGTTVNTLLAS